ncbi:ABC transporter ATP-binding protein [Caldimonas brevitalea]|uniref:ABC transporter n=1 Tax=Caldimonas brevitalea TaxID=413882 RepID=A0A0G3BP21_9BURK|nr:ABC transporter ATP-binding protein [Caldimonas brevitalea]AKJ29743.1 ABC transporter [Caldimonas brevitalea]
MTAGLIVEHLSVGYRGRTVLQSVDLPAVPSGSLVAVVGPNGAGKSTLLRALAGLVAAQGQVWLDGTDLQQLRLPERLQRVGYLPQALPQPTSLLAYEALLCAARAALPGSGRRQIETRIETRIETLVERLGLGALALRRIDELSGGQRQLLGLAQVLVREPALLLLDEPTSALDLRWQLRVLQGVRDLLSSRGGICLVALHDLNLALRLCDRMLVLGHGGVLAQGPPADIFTPALLRRAYGVQGRVERCSQGQQMVVVDHTLDDFDVADLR